MKEEERENSDNKEQDNIVKITITKESAEALAELVAKVNDGFEAGRVHRQDLASWIINRFRRTCGESDLMQIRQLYYNDTAMLEALYRRMRETGEVPEFLKEALRKQFQGSPESIKKGKRQLTKEYINDVQSDLEDAA